MHKIKTSILGLVLCSICSMAFADDPFAGMYREIRPAQPTHSGNKIDVRIAIILKLT